MDFNWIYFVSKRFSRVDRKGRSAVTSFLASLGIFFGVMTLIVTLSVMNGFQMGFIEAIMEISSYHLRVSDLENENEFLSFCKDEPSISSVVPFYEAQSLMVGRRGRQSAAVVRALPKNVLDMDLGFKEQLSVYSGSFDLSSPNSILLGSELSRKL
ncbi:MAG: ABC transporter permease, partial [Treponema sp.]|nr:ABC transporter permease [Treponema sp.]